MNLLKRYSIGAKQLFKQCLGFSKSSDFCQDLVGLDPNIILLNWEIDKFNIKKNLGGSSGANWLLQTPQGKYVLRNAGANSQYLDFQLFIINKLAECKFEYSIPHPLKTKGDYCVQYKGSSWLLYRFIEGTPLKTISNAVQAKNIGTLVASYHKITQEIDYTFYKDYFNLDIFNKHKINACLGESAELIPIDLINDQLGGTFRDKVLFLLEFYNKISDSDIQAIKELVKMPIYNDWNGYNILSDKNKISALIDFDSVVEAARIADFQNALIYVAGTNEGIDRLRMEAFIQGYCSILPLSASEVCLIYPLMIDRLACLIADILEERRLKQSGYKDNFTSLLINLATWLIKNKDEFVNHLIKASTGS